MYTYIYIGIKAAPLSITVRGVNLVFDAARIAEGGHPTARCRLGALNVFNASVAHMSASETLQGSTEAVPIMSDIVCTLPALIRQSDGTMLDSSGMLVNAEAPGLVLEVSVNGRDFSDSALQRARTGGGFVQVVCVVGCLCLCLHLCPCLWCCLYICACLYLCLCLCLCLVLCLCLCLCLCL